MPSGTTSYLLRSIAFRMDAAESSEISCSPDRPPNNTPTRSFFFALPLDFPLAAPLFLFVIVLARLRHSAVPRQRLPLKE